MKRSIIFAALTGAGVLALASTAAAQSNVDSDLKYAWAENIGWTNWRDADNAAQGVRINLDAGILSGFIWAENAGWISTGDGDGPYSNLTGDTHGVNILPDGTLEGLAWGENIGWVNFGTEPTLGADGARVDLAENRLRGYAWGENVGWINLDDANAFVAFIDCPADLDGDGQVGASDLAALLGDWGQDSPADFDNSGAVDAADLANLLGSWGPCPD